MSANVIGNMFEAGSRLKLSASDLMSAAIAYHKVAQKLFMHDPYYRNILAAGALCAHFDLAQRQLDLESVVAVYYEIIYRQSAVENMDKSEYTYLKEHIPMTSKCVAWVLCHDTLKEHPMNYLVSYLRTVQFVLGLTDVRKILQLREQAWVIMQCFVQDELCINYRPDYVALTVLFLAVVKVSIEIVPVVNLKDSIKWFEKLIPNFDQEIFYKMIESIKEGKICRSISMKSQTKTT